VKPGPLYIGGAPYI
jgi:hypothetical protein